MKTARHINRSKSNRFIQWGSLLKPGITTLLTFGLLACGSSTTTTGQNPDHRKGTLTSASAAKLNDGSNSHETCLCNFDSILNHPETPKLAKDIYLDRDWNIGNDTEMLALLDSLTASNNQSRAFYFKVVTQSERKSDGYYTEALSYAGYHFVLNHTAAFAAYFDDRTCHTSEDLKTWARIVAMEIAMNGERNEPLKAPIQHSEIINRVSYFRKTSVQQLVRYFFEFPAELMDGFLLIWCTIVTVRV